MKRMFSISLLVLLAFAGQAQTNQTVDIVIPGSQNPGWPPGEALHTGYIVPFRLVIPPRAVQTLNGTGYIKKRYPLVLFGHGIGERSDGNGVSGRNNPRSAFNGTDLPDLTATAPMGLLNNMTSSGLGNQVYAAPGRTDSTQFIFAAGQGYGGLGGNATDADGVFFLTYFNQIYNYLYANYNDLIDWTRVYLTGLSWGGGWVFTVAQDSVFNGKIAAAVAICGSDWTYNGFRPSGRPAGATTNFAFLARSALPLYLFASTDDNVITPCNIQGIANNGACKTVQFVDSINKYNPKTPPTFIEYSTGKHAIWDRVYAPGYQTSTWPMANGNTSTFMQIPIWSRLLLHSLAGRRR